MNEPKTLGDLLDLLEREGFVFESHNRRIMLEHACPDCQRGGPVREIELIRDERGELVLVLGTDL